MLKTQRSDTAAPEFVRAWELADGTRCVLAVVGLLLEVRIVRDEVIIRHAQFSAVPRALSVAELWRIECELGWGPSLLSVVDGAHDQAQT